MKLKILTPLAGTGFAHAINDIVEGVEEAEAKRWIKAGYAVEVRRTATKKPAKETR